MKYKYFAFLLLLAISLVGCSNKVEVFETTIDMIEEDGFQVNCSDEVNRNKKGLINDIGYICRLDITEETRLLDANNKEISFEQFSSGEHVRITLTKPINISEENRRFTAKEIIKME